MATVVTKDGTEIYYRIGARVSRSSSIMAGPFPLTTGTPR
jgi:hypothetical protein